MMIGDFRSVILTATAGSLSKVLSDLRSPRLLFISDLYVTLPVPRLDASQVLRTLFPTPVLNRDNIDLADDVDKISK